MVIRYLKDYEVLSIENFQEVSLEDRWKINECIEESYLMSPLSQGNSEDGYNFAITVDNTLFFRHLYEKYVKLCYELFGGFNITPQNKSTCWCYRSNKELSLINWHNHLATSTINGVYYYQIEKDGIAFERDGKEFYHVPQQEELLIFPNNLNHKPEETTSENWRYSINMEILTEESSSTLFNNLYGLS